MRRASAAAEAQGVGRYIHRTHAKVQAFSLSRTPVPLITELYSPPILGYN
jgi:hypothetical protein